MSTKKVLPSKIANTRITRNPQLSDIHDTQLYCREPPNIYTPKNSSMASSLITVDDIAALMANWEAESEAIMRDAEELPKSRAAFAKRQAFASGGTRAVAEGGASGQQPASPTSPLAATKAGGSFDIAAAMAGEGGGQLKNGLVSSPRGGAEEGASPLSSPQPPVKGPKDTSYTDASDTRRANALADAAQLQANIKAVMAGYHDRLGVQQKQLADMNMVASQQKATRGH